MWDFSIGRTLGLMGQTLPFLAFRVIVYFGVALAFVLATGVGAGVGWGVGAFGDADFRAGSTAWGGLIGFALVAGTIFFLREYLDQQLATSVAERAAEGWGGDRYVVYWNEATDGLVMALRLVWDTAEDATEFAAAYPDYPAGLLGVVAQPQPDGSACWVRGEAICFLQSGAESWVVRAPDTATAAAVLVALRAPSA